jgi:hypothetical protein
MLSRRMLLMLGLGLVLVAFPAHAHDQGTPQSVGVHGVSGLWVLANISYAGMRAQNSQNSGWRILAFIFGFPGTFVSFLSITEGSGRAYGIELPKSDDF